MLSARARGEAGERLAAAYLESRGHRVIARQVKLPPYGEIDLVTVDRGMTVCVEVRTRTGTSFGGAVGSITATKRRRMIRAAYAYQAAHPDITALRIDVVAVTLDQDDRVQRVEHFINAVTAD